MRESIQTAMLCGILLAAGLISGCSSDGGRQQAESGATAMTEQGTAAETEAEEESEETEEYSGDQVQIHYAYWQTSLLPYLEECKDRFEKKNPGIRIVLEPTGWDDYWTMLEGATDGGSAPDVFQMNGPNINKYAEAGLIKPLDSFIGEGDIDLSNYPRSMVTLYEVNGKHYGIPIDYDTIGLWYNKDLFDQAGVEYPTADWTWDDLKKAAEKLTDPDKGIYGISAGYADQAGIFNTIYANGGYVVSDDGTKSGFDQKETIEGIRMWTDLMKRGYSPSQESIDETADYVQFMDGKIAMFFGGDWYAVTFADPESHFGDKCDVQYLPKIKGRTVSVIHGKANCIYSRTEYPEEAWKWTAFLGGAECNKILGESGAVIPAYKEFSDLYFEEFPQYCMGIFQDEATDAVEYPHGHGAAEWSTIIEGELRPVYDGKADLYAACSRIETKMNMILGER